MRIRTLPASSFATIVHAGFATPDIRIRVMNALVQHLPLLLALSTSSPFHGGRLTGLKSYRQSAIAALPRTGIPPVLHEREEFDRIVHTYRQMGAIEDASELRWDIRPSAHYPTIELRICDICPRVEDAIAPQVPGLARGKPIASCRLDQHRRT